MHCLLPANHHHRLLHHAIQSRCGHVTLPYMLLPAAANAYLKDRLGAGYGARLVGVKDMPKGRAGAGQLDRAG